MVVVKVVSMTMTTRHLSQRVLATFAILREPCTLLSSRPCPFVIGECS